MNYNKYICALFLSIITYVSCISLQGCIVGESCAVPTPAEQSKYFADSDWVNSNLDKEAFEFECKSKAYPPIPGTNGTVFTTIGIAVKDIYLDAGRPTTANIAQVRANALQKAKQASIDDIKRSNPTVKEVTEVICRETKMEPPKVFGECKVSENDSDGAPPDVIGPQEPLPQPTSTSASFSPPVYSKKSDR